MPFIRYSEPDILPAYLTAPISASAIKNVREQFALGSQERFSPLVKLGLDETRTDMYGKSPEQIMEALENGAEETPDWFLVLDQDTETNGSVWLCGGWACEGDFGEDEVKARFPFLQRARTTAAYAPDAYINVEVANLSIPEMDGVYLGDPTAPYEIEDLGGLDWAREKPRPAYVCALQGEYEVSEQAATTLGGATRLPLVRLKEDAARQLGVVQAWTVVSFEVPEEGEGAVVFTADWAWSPGA